MSTDRRLALLWTVFVTLLLLAPLPALFGELASDDFAPLPYDKLAHVALFVPLGWSWLDAAAVVRRLSTRAAGVIAALVAWGGALELMQGWSGWRRGEWPDLAADLVGAVLALALPRWWPFGRRGGL